jgi:hypothetical protein
MNVSNIQNILIRKTGRKPKASTDAALASLAGFLEQHEIADYLRYCLPEEVIEASGARVLPLSAIQEEMAEGAAPGSFVRPFGYLVVATSIGGNAVCFHSPSGKVFWVDHVSFNTKCISFKDRATGQWKYLYEYTPENVQKALVPLSDNIENFLGDLLADRLTKQLEALD